MDISRRCTAVLLTAIFLIVIPASGNGFIDADDTALIRIYEVDPFGDSERVSLFNYGDHDVDLKGYSLSDGEGTIRFTETLMIGAFSEMIIMTGTDSDGAAETDGIHVPGLEGIKKSGSYIMADVGDDVHLYREEILIDTVCYRSGHSEDGWSGDPVPLSTGKYIVRTGTADTDTSADWISTRPGFTDMPFKPDRSFGAVVSPFTFPESGGEPIYREMEDAEKEIRISAYLLTSLNLVSLLCELESRTGDDHIDVTVTLEGNPLGYDIGRELSLMKSLTSSGGEVRIINDPLSGNYERYAYFHNKYAVIDDRTVILTTENWTDGNMGAGESNRGWGVIAESEDYAAYMNSVFEADRDISYGDVWELDDYYPDLRPYAGRMKYEPPSREYPLERYDADIVPILSPDNSYPALKHYIDNSAERVYSEQLDLGSSFSNLNPDSPVAWMASATKRGVDSRFILDASVRGNEASHVSEVGLINIATGVKAITISGGEGFTTTHNKGVIVDDAVWIGSVNWTENSFRNNRETAVMIMSTGAAEYFAGHFLKDWGINDHTMEDDGLEITSDSETITEGSATVFRVSGPEGHTYAWDVYGDGEIRISGTPAIVCSDMRAGTYTMTVTAEDTQFSAECTFTVIPSDTAEESDTSTSVFILAAVAAVLSGTGYAAFKRRYKKDH